MTEQLASPVDFVAEIESMYQSGVRTFVEVGPGARLTGMVKAIDLKDIIDRSYANFDHPQITPLVKQDNLYILELFHGPTLAFKDVALQFLGNLFEYFLQKSGQKMNIVGATSGDTGSAAIYGVKGKKNINIFILHPKGRVSPIQELQMTTVVDDNVFNIAVEGTFDDAQAIVKDIFGDRSATTYSVLFFITTPLF